MGIVLCYIVAFRLIGYSYNNILAISIPAFSIPTTCTGIFHTGVFQPQFLALLLFSILAFSVYSKKLCVKTFMILRTNSRSSII